MTETQKTEQLTRENFREQGEGQQAANLFTYVSSGMHQQNNFMPSNLFQIFSSYANASKRVIKKPARRLRK
ncbi:hypothetical protein BpHYR1_001090 [Brachionus plicatilis]|uniref:Uncharacterized protein n=1 Tax=Brachionus plicatilis TaxID=10195 RepID=A0A3M7RHR7_BRAPC|nr:hypothetical protein BpHYR1_001090 [Brachionus plicatilis]